MEGEIRLNAFTMNCLGHQSPGLWTHPQDRTSEHGTLAYWTDLAQILEEGLFDGVFLADVLGLYDVYGGGPEAALRNAVQVPAHDPLLVVPAMAAVTQHPRPPGRSQAAHHDATGPTRPPPRPPRRCPTRRRTCPRSRSARVPLSPGHRCAQRLRPGQAPSRARSRGSEYSGGNCRSSGARIAVGALVRLLPGYEPPPLPVQLVVPGGRHMAPRVRAFLDHASTRLGTLKVIRPS